MDAVSSYYRHLLPFLALTPLHQEVVRLRGRCWVRSVHLGKLGEISKERLYAASFGVARKLVALGAGG